VCRKALRTLTVRYRPVAEQARIRRARMACQGEHGACAKHFHYRSAGVGSAAAALNVRRLRRLRRPALANSLDGCKITDWTIVHSDGKAKAGDWDKLCGSILYRVPIY
jgi:hypothetical protein